MCQLVPYSLKEKTEHKLEKLVRLGIYHPVASSTWAAPLVPVFTWEGSIQICSNYKQTVNKAADCDKYSIPKTEDIFAKLNGEKSSQTRLQSNLSATSAFTKFKRSWNGKS